MFSVIILALIVLVSVCSALKTASFKVRSTSRLQANIVETAVSAGSFKTLVAAVTAAGLADTLSGPGPFSVFAPTDEAFAKLPKGTVDGMYVYVISMISFCILLHNKIVIYSSSSYHLPSTSTPQLY
jgi:uncharacterized surface protein with fasciclin (FAS1) repeats